MWRKMMPELRCCLEHPAFFPAQITKPPYILTIHVIQVYDERSARVEMPFDAFKTSDIANLRENADYVSRKSAFS